MKEKYLYTIYACYLGFVVQAIINNLAPLLFLTFQQEFAISIDKIGLLISINFGVQIVVDILAANYIDRIGYRVSIVMAHVFCVVGLLGMGIFPFLFGTPYIGLVTAVVLNAIGSGLIEVMASPIVEATPSSNAKEAAMSLLHSFYCWGHVGVVLLSTIGFQVFGMDKWYYVPIIWAAIPLLNAILFLKVPICTLDADEEKLPLRKLFSLKLFRTFFLLMLCGGAAEQAMAQWASMFAEKGLGQSKTVGDLLGPCFFAVMMGIARAFYGRFGDKISLRKFMIGSSVLCVCSYLMTVLMSSPILALLGFGLCGLSVGIMWPGTLSLSAKMCPQGGAAMFAVLALAGDIGCVTGPAVVSVLSDLKPQYGLKAGFAAAIVFPVIMITILFRQRKGQEGTKEIDYEKKGISIGDY